MTRLTITGTGTLTMTVTGMTIRNWGSALKKHLRLGAKLPSLRSLFPDPSLKSINKSNICTNNSFIYINISFILINISFIYTFLRGGAKYLPG